MLVHIYNMREWLSGGAPPCQGGGRGFDPRLALSTKTDIRKDVRFFVEARDPHIEIQKMRKHFLH